ncbi:MAG: FAD-binding protein [Myxococcota bacterium]
MAKTLVVAEHFKGKIKPVTFAALSFAKQVGGDYDIVVIGANISGVVNSLKPYGAKKIYKVEKAELERYLAFEYSAAIAEAAKSSGAEYVTMATSAMAKDLMPVVAARLNAGMASDITAFDGGKCKRAMYAGNAIAVVEIISPVKVVTVLGTSFERAQPSGGESPVEEFSPAISAGKVKWVAMDETVSERPELTEARVVVSGGRGIKDGENKKIIEGLADKLKAAVGWTRAVIDAGWAPNDLQVGQTGKIVAPELYFAIGLSGAIQHLAGMKGSKTIVAINKDPEAPIFSVADYGMVADLFKVVPELTEKIPSPGGE